MFKLAKNTNAFIPFIMAGTPHLNATREALFMLNKMNVAAIEVGVPFSDPIADGPVNQEAAMIGLKNNTTLHAVIELLSELRREAFTTPIILFTYLNPILAMGFETFIAMVKKAQIQAVLIVDLPAEEGHSFYQQLLQAGIAPVLLVSPTTNSTRYQIIKALQPAFIYYISRCAVTGMEQHIREGLKTEVMQIKDAFIEHAVAVGFGISNAAHAKKIVSFADAAIVGSALVKHLNQDDMSAFYQLANEIQQSVQGVCHEEI